MRNSPGQTWHRSILLLLALALLVVGLAATLYGPAGPGNSEHAEGLDDAYISYRYALNLVEGQGLVFNPGEKIEGFSNLLWVLVTALLLGFCPPSLIHYAVCGVSALLAVGSMLVLENEMRRRHGENRALAVAALWAAYPYLWQWVSTGLESVAMVFLQLMIWRTLSRTADERNASAFPWRPLVLLLSLVVFLRADGFILIFLIAFHFVLDRRPAWALRTFLAGAPATLALFGFRLYYYQDILPSTYYVKVAHPLLVRVGGAFELLAELLFKFLMAPFLLALLWLAWRTFTEWRASASPKTAETQTAFRFPPELSLSAGLVAYWLYIGGDNFHNRFLLLLIPLGLVVIFGPLAEGLSRDRQTVLVAVFLVSYSGLIWSYDNFTWKKDRYDGWIELGNFLGERFPNAVVAAEAIGKTPYFSRLYTIDMLGLCDAHISKLPPVRRAPPGHEKSDPDYVLSRRPDIIVGHLMTDLSVRPDITQDMYTSAGYRLTYLVSMNTQSRPSGNIVPAPRSHQEAVVGIFSGYTYAVLIRDPSGRPQEPLR